MRSPNIAALQDQIRTIGASPDLPRFSWGAGVALRLGAVHEWFGEGADRGEWHPPLTLLSGLVMHARRQGLLDRVVWIGRRAFPFPGFLDSSTLGASLFVDPPGVEARVWAIDLALRASVCVGGDGVGVSLACSRRLQLAAGCGRGIGLLARPGFEERELSAATTRWRVEPGGVGDGRVAWRVTLRRHKDQPALTVDARAWMVEWDDAKGLVVVPAVVADGADRAASHASS